MACKILLKMLTHGTIEASIVVLFRKSFCLSSCVQTTKGSLRSHLQWLPIPRAPTGNQAAWSSHCHTLLSGKSGAATALSRKTSCCSLIGGARNSPFQVFCWFFAFVQEIAHSSTPTAMRVNSPCWKRGAKSSLGDLKARRPAATLEINAYNRYWVSFCVMQTC